MLLRLVNPQSRLVSVLFIITILLGACARAPQEMSGFEEAAYAPAVAEAPRYDTDKSFQVNSMSAISYQDVERIVITNASLSIVVSDPSASLDYISKMAQDMEGFVVSANLFQRELDSGETVSQASITIRVPAGRLNDTIEQIKNQSNQDPLSESRESQDVTRDYTDLQSRLRNLESAEAQLQKIMDTATKTEDVLSVYNQLVQVREQIEVIKGQIIYLESSAALSAINVELIADKAVQPLTVGGWQPAGVAKNAIQALINGLKFLANAVIWIVIFVLPIALALFLVVFLPIYLIWWVIRRRRSNQKKQSISPQPPTKGQEP